MPTTLFASTKTTARVNVSGLVRSSRVQLGSRRNSWEDNGSQGRASDAFGAEESSEHRRTTSVDVQIVDIRNSEGS